jgi:pilus assembly protein Flp/PilA
MVMTLFTALPIIARRGDPKARLTGYCSQEMGARLFWKLSARGQSGQGMVEYALILVMVAIVIIVVLISLGGQVKNMFSNISVALGT